MPNENDSSESILSEDIDLKPDHYRNTHSNDEHSSIGQKRKSIFDKVHIVSKEEYSSSSEEDTSSETSGEISSPLKSIYSREVSSDMKKSYFNLQKPGEIEITVPKHNVQYYYPHILHYPQYQGVSKGIGKKRPLKTFQGSQENYDSYFYRNPLIMYPTYQRYHLQHKVKGGKYPQKISSILKKYSKEIPEAPHSQEIPIFTVNQKILKIPRLIEFEYPDASSLTELQNLLGTKQKHPWLHQEIKPARGGEYPVELKVKEYSKENLPVKDESK